jgi:large subunit ribosomal protein L7/L12
LTCALAFLAAACTKPAIESAPATASVILDDGGAQKVLVIKEVRAVTGLGLKEAKDLVDAAPSTVKSGIPLAEAKAIRDRLVAAGAKVSIR